MSVVIWKVLVALAVFAAIWATLFRSGRNTRREGTAAPSRKAPTVTQDLVKCRSCGIYLPAGRTCDCADRA